jgi:hypothetical protein
MQVKVIGQTQRWIDVAPGSLFNYDVDNDYSAVGFRVIKNQLNVDAIAFTHNPRPGVLPAFVSSHFFENDRAVFVYENPVFQPDQGRETVSRDVIPAGAFLSIAAGSFMRCYAGPLATACDINLESGEVTSPVSQRAIWTVHWKLRDCFEGLIYQQ